MAHAGVVGLGGRKAFISTGVRTTLRHAVLLAGAWRGGRKEQVGPARSLEAAETTLDKRFKVGIKEREVKDQGCPFCPHPLHEGWGLSLQQEDVVKSGLARNSHALLGHLKFAMPVRVKRKE